MHKDMHSDEIEFSDHRRHLYGCSDCENTWDTMYDVGLADVCAVVASGELTGDVRTAVKIF